MEHRQLQINVTIVTDAISKRLTARITIRRLLTSALRDKAENSSLLDLSGMQSIYTILWSRTPYGTGLWPLSWLYSALLTTWRWACFCICSDENTPNWMWPLERSTSTLARDNLDKLTSFSRHLCLCIVSSSRPHPLLTSTWSRTRGRPPRVKWCALTGRRLLQFARYGTERQNGARRWGRRRRFKQAKVQRVEEKT